MKASKVAQALDAGRTAGKNGPVFSIIVRLLHQFHQVHQLVLRRDILLFMKRATMTLPDDLAEAVAEYVKAQDAPPALTTVMQVALREYLLERGFLRPFRPLKITPAPQGSGLTDVSVNHDKYFAEGEE